jgi:hypothetical protein
MKNLFTPEELAAAVDTIAEIKAQIADLKQREDTYKAVLVASECPAIDGTLHRASISWSSRTTINWEAIARAAVKPALLPDLIENNTTTGEKSPTLRLTARKTTA